MMAVGNHAEKMVLISFNGEEHPFVGVKCAQSVYVAIIIVKQYGFNRFIKDIK